MCLLYTWNSIGSLPDNTIQVSSAFCRNIAGLTPKEFQARFVAGDLSLPCSPLQFLSYCIDGAICVKDGQMSWTR
jgi:hypothetical protein